MSPIHDFATWVPVLRLLWESNAETLAEGGRVAGRIGSGSWSLPLRRRSPRTGRPARAEDMRAEFDAVDRVRDALAESGADGVAFALRVDPAGRATLDLFGPGGAAEPGIGGPYPGDLLLVEGALAAPWRKPPDPVPDAVPAPTADPGLLERTLRAALPDTPGATEEEIAAAEARLGTVLPDELKAVYRVTRACWDDWKDDPETADRVFEAVDCELLALDHLYLADATSRPARWEFAAMEAAVTGPDDRVQGVVGSPGWIVFGDNGGGDRIAVDLTPGPRGYAGQIIMIGHEENIGAELLADSLTDWVGGRRREERRNRRDRATPAVAYVNRSALPDVETAADPLLEVLSIGVRDDEPVSLAPVVGLPRLRTLSAYAGTLADPLEIAGLTALEFLELGPEDWRTLLDAGAVPRGLLAAAIMVRYQPDLPPVVDLANEILGLFGRPPIPRTVREGDLGAEA
ncbi:SMI1/KNR4 family protein [Streptomyces sp. NPDC008125]|uniref:SMI1/KNR4 family protein n=1 Tax=Streptomyces sp. NPDC008125 TaxID=3364811 RepID=UPI0036EE0CB2